MSVYEPGGQASQKEASEPVLPICRPVAHFVHSVAPVASLCFPVSHTTHVSLFSAPTALDERPRTQLAHALTPNSSEYLPASQNWHVAELIAPTSVENVPIGQGWTFTAPLGTPTPTESAAKLPAKTRSQVLESLAPTAGE